MPSNLATRKASPGSLVASAKVCAPLDQKKHLQINAQIKKVMFYFIKSILQRTKKKGYSHTGLTSFCKPWNPKF
jgi:hypothetical protein